MLVFIYVASEEKRKDGCYLRRYGTPGQQVAGGSEKQQKNSDSSRDSRWLEAVTSNSRTATTADILAAEYQLPRSVDRHKTMSELLSVCLQVISVSLLLPAVFLFYE